MVVHKAGITTAVSLLWHTMEFFIQPTVQDLQARVGEGSLSAQASGKGPHIKQAILDEALECVWNQLGPRLSQLSSASVAFFSSSNS